MADNNTQFNTITMELPDGNIQLITWDFVKTKFNEILNQSVSCIENINTQLERIDTKLDDWIPED